MSSGRFAGRIAVVVGGTAIVAAGALSACSPSSEKDAPSTSTTPPTTSAPSASPTEKAIGPGGNNFFSPTINPAPPGAVCKEVVNGVCVSR